MATRLPGPRAARLRPPMPGVLALAVLAHHDPVHRLGVASRSGLGTPGSRRTGRMLAYWSKPWQMASRRPHRADVIGHARPADRAEVDGVEAAATAPARPGPSSGRFPGSTGSPRGRSRMRSGSDPSLCSASRSSTRRPSGTTSCPMPSPGITAILKVWLVGSFIGPPHSPVRMIPTRSRTCAFDEKVLAAPETSAPRCAYTESQPIPVQATSQRGMAVVGYNAVTTRSRRCAKPRAVAGSGAAPLPVVPRRDGMRVPSTPKRRRVFRAGCRYPIGIGQHS